MKILVYLLLMAAPALVGVLRSPFLAALSCVLAYLLNPVIFTEDEIRFQLFSNGAFLLSCIVNGTSGVPAVGKEGIVLRLLWAFVGIAALSSTWAVVSGQLAVDTSWEVAKTMIFASLLC